MSHKLPGGPTTLLTSPRGLSRGGSVSGAGEATSGSQERSRRTVLRKDSSSSGGEDFNNPASRPQQSIPMTSPQQAVAKRGKRGSENYKYLSKQLSSPRLSANQTPPQPATGSALEQVAQAAQKAYNSIPNKTDTFRYFQRLHYPFEALSSSELQQSASRGKEFERIISESRETLPGEEAANEEAAVEEDTQSVSALALSTFSDPVSGAPVFSVLVGDYGGHMEYVEISACNESNRLIKRSKAVVSRTEGFAVTCRTNSVVEDGNSTPQHTQLTDAASASISKDLRGREVVRRVSHSAYIKSINALTSVSVDPGVKCLSFVPHTSPSTLSYLTANQRVVKLFRIRREGFSPLDCFPEVEDILRRYQDPVPRYSRFPPPQTILPVKEFGPATNSIQQLSLSADCQTFMSIEDLQIFWWDMEASDTTRGSCIVDLNPPSGDLNEVEELVTAANFHPTHGSLFLMSRSSGALNIGDLRDPPCRSERKFAISTKVLPHQNPVSSSPFDEILCSISSASFLGNDHVVTRDYLSMKLWDLRKASVPYATAPVMKYMAPFLEQLYENDCIFDRFPLALDSISGAVVTGMYDGAVTLWQPLSNHCDVLQHYRADLNNAPGSSAARNGRVSMSELQKSTEAGFQAASEQPDRIVLPELLHNKVLCLDIAPGGERFAYGSKDGKQETLHRYRLLFFMSVPGFGAADPFRGLRELPRHPEQLRHHLSNIHHTMQSTFFVDSDTAHFVLRPEKRDEFYKSYTQEVERIFRHLSNVTQRQIKVRVNPQRYRKGYEVLSSTGNSTSGGKAGNGVSMSPPSAVYTEDPAWLDQMAALGRKLQDSDVLESFRQQTPDSQISYPNNIDSDIRLHKDSHIFKTPPEFQGFTMANS